MSPILLRPVREQLEHDRVIRLLQAKYKRKSDVAINPGNEQGTPVMVGQSPWYPDLVLLSNDRGRKVLGTFAMYHREPREPTLRDLTLVDLVTQTAALVIDRERAQEALRNIATMV